MPVPGRPVFHLFPEWMKISFYIMAFFATMSFLYGMFRRVQKYRKGAPDPRFDRLPVRFWEALKGVALSTSVGYNDRYVGWAHGMIAWGWMFLVAGTATIMIDEDLVGVLWPERKFLHGNFYLGYSLTLDITGMAFIAGLLMMRARRKRRDWVRLDYSRADRPADQYNRSSWGLEDLAFIGIITAIAVTGFLIEAVRIAETFPPWELWSPFGWMVARVAALMGIAGETALIWHKGLWWFHAFMVFALIARMPYAKGLHMFTSFAALMFRDPLAGRRLPPAQPRPGQDYSGVKALTDLTWAQLLMLDACTRCGRCHELCPARGQGAPLSPRDLVLDLREWADRQFGIPGAKLSFQVNADGAASLAGGVIQADTLWACTTCRACVDTCPAGIEHVPMIVQMRRRLVDEGEMDENLQGALEKLARQGNSFGQPGRMRARWSQGLGFEIKDARKEPVEYLWFVGDYASYDPRVQEETRRVARLFHRAGLDFGILYDGERNSGNDVRRAGEEGLFELLAEHNIRQLQAAQFKKIVTTDPHTYNTLRFEYPGMGAGFEVVHYTEVLAELLSSGRLPVYQPLNRTVTYHDPCYLGRYAGIFAAPRQVLQAVGCEVREMPRNRERSYCCGAGGGRIWSGDNLYSGEKPAESRIREALALGDADAFVVACPKDMVMYRDAVKTTGSDGQIDVVDIIQLVEAATAAPEPALAATEG